MKVTNVISDVFTSIGVKLNTAEDVYQQADMLSLIEDARKEWLAAKNYFDNVSDPDLIDHAVFVSQAAEKRYMYLLKQARSQGLSSGFPTPINE